MWCCCGGCRSNAARRATNPRIALKTSVSPTKERYVFTVIILSLQRRAVRHTGRVHVLVAIWCVVVDPTKGRLRCASTVPLHCV